LDRVSFESIIKASFPGRGAFRPKSAA
jgi:hypothetical protein